MGSLGDWIPLGFPFRSAANLADVLRFSAFDIDIPLTPSQRRAAVARASRKIMSDAEFTQKLISLLTANNSASSSSSNRTQCSICLDEITFLAVLNPCMHQFCHMCIFEWYKMKDVCPVCRTEIDKIGYNIQPDGKHGAISSSSHAHHDPDPLADYVGNGPVRVGPIPAQQRQQYRERAQYFALSRLQTLGIMPSGGVQPQVGVQPPLLPPPAVPALPLAPARPTGPVYCTRFISVTLTQMLATLYQKYPNLGFPTSPLDYTSFRAAINFAVSEELVPAYYRCFLYMHDYDPVDNMKGHRQCDLKFFRENPALLHRLFNFVKLELVCFTKAFKSVLGTQCDTIMTDVNALLHSVDLQSGDFAKRFREIIYMFEDKLVEKLHRELIFFARCSYTEHDSFVFNVQYECKTSKAVPTSSPTATSSPNTPAATIGGSEASNSSTQNVPTTSSNNNPADYSFDTQQTPRIVSDYDRTPGEAGGVNQTGDEDPQEGPSRPRKVARQDSTPPSTSTGASSSIQMPSTSGVQQQHPSRRETPEIIELTSSDSEPEENPNPPQPPSRTNSNKREASDSSSSGVEFLGANQRGPPLRSVSASGSRGGGGALDYQKPGPSGLQKMAKTEHNSIFSKSKLPPSALPTDLRLFQRQHRQIVSKLSKKAMTKEQLPSSSTSQSNQQITNLQYDRKDFMRWRRTIRYAADSPYFYKKLLREVRKKFCGLDTILNEPEFAQLEGVFNDMYCNSKLRLSPVHSSPPLPPPPPANLPGLASLQVTAVAGPSHSSAPPPPSATASSWSASHVPDFRNKQRANTMDELKRILERNAHEEDVAFNGGGSPDLARNKAAHLESSTDEEVTDGDVMEQDAQMHQYEVNNRGRLHDKIVGFARGGPQQAVMTSKQYFSQRRANTIQFVNNLYTDDSDDE